MAQAQMTQARSGAHGLAPGPDIRTLDEQAVLHSYGRQPLVIARGAGMRVYADDGGEYLDFTSGIGVCSLGHCHPRLVAAVTDQVQSLWHMSNLYVTEPQARLAARLTTACGLDRVFFSNSGAEANEAAIKFARRYAKRRYGAHKGEILTFAHGFHGRTLATVTATAKPAYQMGFGPLPGGFRYVSETTIPAVLEAASPATCAVLIEPIQGEGGVLPVSSEFLRSLRELCTARGWLLLADEVQTGCGRTGTWLRCDAAGVRPDVVTLAKGLGGGLPIGATLCTDEVAEVMGPGSHGSTFGGNPVATRAACEVIDIVLEAGFLEHVRAGGERVLRRLTEMAERCGIRACRGAGLMWGIEISGSAAAVVDACRERGLLVLTAGEHVVRLLPPLIASDAELDEGLRILEQAFMSVADTVEADAG